MPVDTYTIIGHRGCGVGRHPAGVYENTIPAFRLAFDEGADEVEMDLSLTADNQIVMVHDEHIRTKRKKMAIRSLKLTELQSLRPEIPTLEEVLNYFPERRFTVELKSHTRWDIITDKLYDKGYLSAGGRLRIISFNPEALLRVKTQSPDIHCGLIATATEPRLSPFVTEKHIAWCKEHGIDEIAGHVWLFTGKMAARVREEKLQVGLGQVDTAWSLRKAVRYGVMRLYTNRPGWLVSQIKHIAPAHL